jgi:predicted nucleic acid-binding protein
LPRRHRAGPSASLDVERDGSRASPPLYRLAAPRARCHVCGFQGGTHRRRNEAELAEFLGQSFVEELRVDHDVARIYAGIVHALRAKGTPIPTNDVWIAAVAARSGATVVAYDDHFAAVDRIGVVLLGEQTSETTP